MINKIFYNKHFKHILTIPVSLNCFPPPLGQHAQKSLASPREKGHTQDAVELLKLKKNIIALSLRKVLGVFTVFSSSYIWQY